MTTRFDERGGRRRERLAARWRRLTHWEYWPAWMGYAPLLPWWTWLALRTRSLTAWADANTTPALRRPVGESKWLIHESLPNEWTVPARLIERGAIAKRLEAVLAASESLGWPIVLKPDVGERGAAVRRVSDLETAERYLRDQAGPVLAQMYEPGPLEIGVFYVRAPGERAGRIFAVTDKRFPAVVGDGSSTLKALIWRDRRLRAQAGVFLRRLGPNAERVASPGERVSIGFAGNHAQGSEFRDGSGLITQELTRAFDEIADRIDGLCFGRFDVRYSDPHELAAGRGFRIIELNGVLSEPTNIYDPSWGFWRAQRVLRAAWALAFEFGATNRARGTERSSARQILRWWAEHRRRPPMAVSD